MTRPSWLGRAVRNRHHHAIEQASRRWRGGRRDDSARTSRKILLSTQVVDGAVALVGEDLRLRAPSFDPREYDDPRDAAKHWKPFAAAPRNAEPFRAAARRDLAKLRAAKDVQPANDVSRRRRMRRSLCGNQNFTARSC